MWNVFIILTTHPLLFHFLFTPKMPIFQAKIDFSYFFTQHNNIEYYSFYS